MNKFNSKHKQQKTIKIGDKEFVIKGCGVYENTIADEKKKADEMSIRSLLKPELAPEKLPRDVNMFPPQPTTISGKLKPVLSHTGISLNNKKGLDKDVLSELEKISERLLKKK